MKICKIKKLFDKASNSMDKENYKEAFKLFSKCSEYDYSCQLNIGYLYDNGLGIKKNKKKAIYWYKRSFKNGCASAANNIGLVFKEQGKYKKAKKWLKKAYKLGDIDALYELAKVLLKEKEFKKVKKYLIILLKNKNYCCEYTVEEAEKLLKKISDKK